MTNIILFAVTTGAYAFILFAFLDLFTSVDLRAKPFGYFAKRLALVALLCLPLNINGNVFTMLGNAQSDKNTLSLFSVYQKAERDTVSLFGSIAQFAGNNAIVAIGIAGWQEANNEAIIGFGLNGYQKSNKDAGGFVLISGYQESKEGTTINVIGATGYQKASKSAGVLCCLVGRQDAGEAGIIIGLAGYQNATRLADTYASAALLQKVGTQERSFAIWSQLRGD